VPFPLLAHQAPLLPLKAWRARWFSGTALVVGSIAPDLEYVVSPLSRGARGFAHSFTGQFVVCLPITLLAVFCLGPLGIGRALAARLAFRLSTSERFSLPTVVTSALVGSFSHVWLDRFTHDFVPHLLHSTSSWRWRGMAWNVASLTELGMTAIGVVIACFVLGRMWTAAPPVPRRADGRALVVGSALLGAALGLVWVRPVFRNPNHYFAAAKIYVCGHALFHAVCGIGLAWLFAGAFLAWRDARVRTHLPHAE
jgi:membrane-bound metal-dependent hydrolase YbcI (DUF457 family)